MKAATGFLLGFDLTVDRGGEMIEPRPGTVEADATWRFVDAQDHGHFYGDKSDRYPTMTWVSEPCTMGHGDDCDSEGHYECKICGEEISPGTRPARAVWVDGPATYRLTVAQDGQRITYQFGEDQWDRLQARFVEAIRDTLGRPELVERFEI